MLLMVLLCRNCVSSAYCTSIQLFISSDISFTKMLTIIGFNNIEPWGTPYMTRNMLPILLFVRTDCVLSKRSFSNQKVSTSIFFFFLKKDGMVDTIKSTRYVA